MVFCFEKLGRMVSHSLHLATVVRGRIGGEGVRCIYLGHSHPTSTKPSKKVKKRLYRVFFVTVAPLKSFKYRKVDLG